MTLTLNYPCGCQATGKDIPLYCPTHGLSPEHRKYAHELAESVVIQWLKRPLDGKEDSHQGLLWIRAAIEKFGERVLSSLPEPHPGLGSGALREALEQAANVALNWSNNLAKEWENSKVKGEIFDPPSKIAFANDAKRFAAEILANVCTEIRALSLSSPIERLAVTCDCHSRPHHPQCITFRYGSKAQASSEIRGQAESILGLVLLKLGFTTDHLTDGQLDRARDIIADALAPSRQGAGGK